MSVNVIYKIIFTTLLILTCASYGVAINVSVDIGREQAKATHSELLSLYMEKMDATFSNADNFLINYISTNDDVLTEVRPENEMEHELSKIAIHQDLSNGALLHSDIDAFFYYNLRDDVYIQARSSQIRDINVYLKAELFRLIESGATSTSGWQLVQMQDDYYMLRMEKYMTAYVGAWISLESIVGSLKETYQKEGGDVVIFDKAGKMLTETPLVLDERQPLDTGLMKSSDGKSFLRLCQESKRTRLVITAYISDNVILADIQKTSIILTGLIIVIALLIVFAMLILKRILFHPLFELNENMKKIKEGDLSIRMRPEIWQHEFNIVYHAFNDMMDEVGQLRIDVYEQQLKYQKMWLQYLQVQIQPHFFLNTLNLIYSMSRLEQNDMIQKLSLYLVQYFRYLFREPLSHVPLETELKHVRNYLEIQKMRFPGKFEYDIQIGDKEKKAVIPPLIIQTFVENCIKHAGYTNKLGMISVTAARHGMNVEITVSDNGRGFSVEMLKLLNDESKTISKDKIYNVGIDNARLRLKLFFNNNYYVMFYNSQGAVVKLVIPYMEVNDHVQRDFD